MKGSLVYCEVVYEGVIWTVGVAGRVMGEEYVMEDVAGRGSVAGDVTGVAAGVAGRDDVTGNAK